MAVCFNFYHSNYDNHLIIHFNVYYNIDQWAKWQHFIQFLFLINNWDLTKDNKLVDLSWNTDLRIIYHIIYV